MGGFMTITVKGTDTIDKELQDVVREMEKPIRRGLETAAVTFAPTLRQHIADDWYDAWGPPKRYLRRTDYPEYGPGLYEQVKEAVVKGDSVEFEYLPSARHSLEIDPETGFVPEGGDDLINIIQYNRGWLNKPNRDRQGRSIMPRPFWNNFVEEMKSGILMDAFEYGFTSGGWTMIREGGDRDMEWANGESML